MSRTRARVALLLLLSVLFGRLARAQDAPAPELVQRSAAWEAVFLDVDLDANPDRGPRFWFDLHLRQRPDVGDKAGSFQGILRPAFGYEFVKGVALWAGYAWIPVVPSGGGLVSEHEAWTQVTLGHTYKPVTLAFRPRFEVRVLDAQTDVALRLRLFERVNVAIAGPFGLAFWDEFFLNLNETAWAKQGVDENRLFAGVGLTGFPGMRAELGYQFRFIPSTTHGPNDTIEHIAMLVLSFTLAPVPAKHAPDAAAASPAPSDPVASR